MNSWHHAQSSAHKWGGEPEDYLPVHEFIDSSKSSMGDVRHRALLHSTWGVYVVRAVFGDTLTVGRKRVPVREIAEQHIMEDLGRLPSPNDWLDNMEIKPWMGGRTGKARTMTWEELGWNND